MMTFDEDFIDAVLQHSQELGEKALAGSMLTASENRFLMATIQLVRKELEGYNNERNSN
jgi:hypothetical protein